MMTLSCEITEFLQSRGAGLVGFADLSALPASARHNLPRAVGFAVTLAPEIVALGELTSLLGDMGYTINHADNITERDIEIGWHALDSKLSEREDEFRAVLGDESVQKLTTRRAQGTGAATQLWRLSPCPGRYNYSMRIYPWFVFFLPIRA